MVQKTEEDRTSNFNLAVEEFLKLTRENISPKELSEYERLILLEGIEVLNNLEREVEKLDDSFFPLDIFFKIEDIVRNYQIELERAGINANEIEVTLKRIKKKLLEKNPLGCVSQENEGYLLTHSSDVSSIRNLLSCPYEHAEICTTVSKLKKRDIFQPSKKKIHLGLIFNPKGAISWFSKDVGSFRKKGRRVLNPENEKFRCSSLKEALNKQNGERIEAWIDAKANIPIGIIILDECQTEAASELSQLHKIPVIFNSHFFDNSDLFCEKIAGSF